MKAVILDFDGVLNSHIDFFEMRKFGHPINEGSKVLNRGLLALLQEIIEQTDAKIVLSTTWRLQFSVDDIYEMFIAHDFSLPRDVFYGVTPNLMRGFSDNPMHHRGAEIHEYLKVHPEIEKFVILDDQLTPITDPQGRYEDDSLEWDNRTPYEGFIKADTSVNVEDDLNANFIHTSFSTGLKYYEGQRAILVLGKNEKTLKEDEEFRASLDLFM